ncbi:ChaN family lipoprotein [Rhodobacteraceae bacterium D3-12]|nr:ChaN family lipoprotein [Rhodobacteraceae bacterium D3-12]
MRRLIVMIWVVIAGAAMAQDLPEGMAGAEVVILGEVHDNAAIHARQAELVAALAPKAVVFEMLTRSQAERAKPSLRSEAGKLEAALGWKDTGWPGFAMYYPIFLASGEAKFYGAAVPRREARAAMKAGIAESFGPEAEAYGLNTALAEAEQAAREQEQHLAHCEAMPPEMLPVMVALQRLRDATLARAVVQALHETGGPVVVITGNGHARRDWGVPRLVEKVAPEVTVFALGLLEEGSGDAARFDASERFPEAERDDPCAAFQKG